MTESSIEACKQIIDDEILLLNAMYGSEELSISDCACASEGNSDVQINLRLVSVNFVANWKSYLVKIKLEVKIFGSGSLVTAKIIILQKVQDLSLEVALQYSYLYPLHARPSILIRSNEINATKLNKQLRVYVENLSLGEPMTFSIIQWIQDNALSFMVCTSALNSQVVCCWSSVQEAVVS